MSVHTPNVHMYILIALATSSQNANVSVFTSNGRNGDLQPSPQKNERSANIVILSSRSVGTWDLAIRHVRKSGRTLEKIENF